MTKQLMNPFTFTDLLQNSLSKSDFFGNVSFVDIIISLIFTFAVSMLIFYIYRKTYSGPLYSHNYNVSLVMMAQITALVIMTISSNLVLSLGMVGALSIVRFRTAVKDPMDIVFMFWSIAVGISCGASLYMISIVGSLFISMVIILLSRYSNQTDVFMLIIHYSEDAKDEVFKIISSLDYRIKSKTATQEIMELTLEITLMGADTKFIDKLSQIYGVRDATLITYNGNLSE